MTKYDAIVVGSGPNGLAAAIKLQMEGYAVLLVEGKETIGGGMRTAEITLPGFKHDICSAVHPMALLSPFFATLPLAEYGLEFIFPPVAAAHPFDDGTSVALYQSLEKTALQLGEDAKQYLSIFGPLKDKWHRIDQDLLGPLTIPSYPLDFAAFGLKALPSASFTARFFETREAKALWAGMAAHSIQPLTNIATSAIGLVLTVAGHKVGWPIPKGGSQSIANAIAAYFKSLGGEIQTSFPVTSLRQLPPSKVVLLDVTPKQLLEIAGDKFSGLYKWQLNRYRYGMGVFKIDWALDGPVPFAAPECRRAGTVHIGNTFEEIQKSEADISRGIHPEKPFVLFSQPSIFDNTRAPEGKHTAWAYCHVPNGSTRDMTEIIENQVERFAPGFKKLILARNTMNAMQVQTYNPNYVGGDINGGVQDIFQLFTRPALRWSPYKTSAKGIYICSSSTPPGGGVHGMCGFHAAVQAGRELRIEN